MGTPEAPRPDVAFFDFELNGDRQELRRAGEPRAVEPRVFRLLEYLIARADRVVPKAEILRELWRGEAISAGVLNQCIWAARQAVDDDGDKQRVIKTVHGVGYRFVAPIATGPSHAGMPTTNTGAVAVSSWVGRDQELATLLADLDAVTTGHGRLRLLLGEAGIGKTHLVHRLAARARARGVTVLSARCFETESMPPYGPWAQLVQALCVSLSSAELRALVRPSTADVAEVAPALRALLPELPLVPPLAPAQARLRLFGSFAAFIRDAAARSPLLVILEDLQAADEPSLSLLELIASSVGDARALLVATHRTEAGESGLMPPRVERLLRCPGAEAMALRGLPPDETAQLIVAHAKTPLHPQLAASVHAFTEGNPLFALEVMRLLALHHVSLGGIDPAAPLPVPERIQQVAAERVRHLPPRCIATLELAAVAGPSVEAALLSAADERPYAEVLADLDNAASAALLQEQPGRPGCFRFCHDVIREAVYRSMPAGARAAQHARIARGLESLSSEGRERLEELAHHYSHGDPETCAERALFYRLAVAQHCSSATAYEDAIRHYEGALTLCRACKVAPAQRAEIRLALGVAQMRAKRVDSARETLRIAAQQALESGATAALAQAALDITPGFLELPTGTTDWLNIQLLESALGALAADHPALRAKLLAGLSVARGWLDSDDVRMQLAQDAVALAERAGEPVALLAARSARQTTGLGPADLDERIVEAQALIREAERLGDHETSLVHRYLHICALIEDGHPDAADRAMSAFVQLATTLRQPQGLWYAQRYTAMRALMAGRFEEAERLGNEFLTVGGKLEPENALQSFGAQLAALYWQTGRSRELLPLIEPHALAIDALPSWQAVLAFVAADCGELTLAREVFERVLRRLEALPHNGHYLMTLNLLSDTCVILGDAARARELLARLAPYGRQHVCVYAVLYRGSIYRNLGALQLLLGARAQGLSLLERGLSEERRVGARPFEALSSYELARGLLDARAPSQKLRARAAELIEQGLATARALGMPELERRLLELGHAEVRGVDQRGERAATK